MAFSAIQLIFILAFPGLIIYFSKHLKVIRWLSPIVVCYLIGILAGNLPFLSINRGLMTYAAEISVGLAIPVLLFSCNFKKWLRHSKSTFLSFFLAMVAVVVCSSLAFVIFHDRIVDAWKVSGMMIGVYTGGTANMTAIGIALDVEEEIFVLLNSADLIFSGIYFLFLITIAKKVFGYFLPPFKRYNDQKEKIDEEHTGFNILSGHEKIKYILISLGLSLLILVTAAGVSLLITGELTASIIILLITTMGIAFSFFSRIHSLKSNYETGEYFLLVFAVAMGSLANFSELISVTNVTIIAYCAVAVLGSAFIHLLLTSLFRIDTDTVIITATAAIFGPAFIAPVAEGIKNKEVIVSGISLGLLGNAIGNYLGLSVAWLLKFLF
ncbi:MAG: DUF819 family protein [Bacteroidales bacterium]|nr:DUF819 family protein [Bacteroidales bacterium]